MENTGRFWLLDKLFKREAITPAPVTPVKVAGSKGTAGVHADNDGDNDSGCDEEDGWREEDVASEPPPPPPPKPVALACSESLLPAPLGIMGRVMLDPEMHDFFRLNVPYFCNENAYELRKAWSWDDSLDADMVYDDPDDTDRVDPEKQRYETRLRAVLRWLAGEVWSSTDILSLVLGLDRRATQRFLEGMVRKKLIIKDSVTILERRALTLWGITDHGLVAACQFMDVEWISGKAYRPDSVRPLMIEHYLLIQKARHFYESEFGAGWIPERLFHQVIEDIRDWVVYPDALFALGSGNTEKWFALEIEKTFKSRERYVAIVKGHAANIRAGHYDYVIYCCENDGKAAALAKLMMCYCLPRVPRDLPRPGIRPPACDGGACLANHFHFTSYWQIDEELRRVNEPEDADIPEVMT